MKNKLKTELFKDKKSLQIKMLFFVITKNLNWEILTKNLISFKRWDGMGMGLEGVAKNQYTRVLPKNEACTICRFKAGLNKKDGVGVFDGEIISQYTLCY